MFWPIEIGIWSAGRKAYGKENFYLAIATGTDGPILLAWQSGTSGLILLGTVGLVLLGTGGLALPACCRFQKRQWHGPLFSADFFKKTEGLHNCKEGRRSATCVMWLPSLQCKVCRQALGKSAQV